MNSPTEDKGSAKSRRELPSGAVATLKAWLLSPEHFSHPYPTPQDQIMLMQKTGIDKKQLKNWFTNARRRIWKPMLKKQLEEGKMTTTVLPVSPTTTAPPPPTTTATATATATTTTNAATQGTPTTAALMPQQHPQPHQMVSSPATQPTQTDAIHTHYAPVQPAPPSSSSSSTNEAPSYDVYGTSIYSSIQPPSTSSPYSTSVPPPQPMQLNTFAGTNANSSDSSSSNYISMPPSSIPSFGSLPNMNKTDSHAVLMELFARDQDLVKHATEHSQHCNTGTGNTNSSISKQTYLPPPSTSQFPMKIPSSTKLVHVPTLDSWPHFSSISSLNNMTGVKSITSMSGADLAMQGNLNQKGNLAQVKSMESFGKHDSYAFLEVFFGDKTINNNNNNNIRQNLNSSSSGSGGANNSSSAATVKKEDMDHDVGLSLDADEGPSSSTTSTGAFGTGRPLGGPTKTGSMSSATTSSSTTNNRPFSLSGTTTLDSAIHNRGTTMKRAYDDAMAARGLISVSRSSEKLTDLALPVKMQRTLSKNFLREHQAKAQQQQQQLYSAAATATTTATTTNTTINTTAPPVPASQQYPGQAPQQQQPIQAPVAAAPAPADTNTIGIAIPTPTPTATSSIVTTTTIDSGSNDDNNNNKCNSQPTTNNDDSNNNEETSSAPLPPPPPDAICARCNTSGRVDAQLKPCGHMFHENCLKPSLQRPGVQPKCPIDGIPIESVLVAVQAPAGTTTTTTRVLGSHLQQTDATNNSTQQQQGTGSAASCSVASPLETRPATWV